MQGIDADRGMEGEQKSRDSGSNKEWEASRSCVKSTLREKNSRSI